MKATSRLTPPQGHLPFDRYRATAAVTRQPVSVSRAVRARYLEQGGAVPLSGPRLGEFLECMIRTGIVLRRRGYAQVRQCLGRGCQTWLVDVTERDGGLVATRIVRGPDRTAVALTCESCRHLSAGERCGHDGLPATAPCTQWEEYPR